MKIYAVSIEELKRVEQEKLLDLLDPDRKQRTMRIKCNEDRLRSIGAGLLLQFAFISYGYTKDEWRRAIHKRSQCGKPSLENYPEFHFSISHSGNWVVCGVHCEEIGLDIQRKKDIDQKIAKRFFAEEEYIKIQDQPANALKAELFYKMWTAKESYVKLVGTSIATGLTEYICDVDNNRIFDTKMSRYAQIEYKNIESDYLLCVCTFQTDSKTELTKVSVNELLEECYAEYDGEKCSTKR